MPICQRTAATDLGIETAAAKRCASNHWKCVWKSRRRAKRVDRLCRINPATRKLHDDGHSRRSSLRPHCTATQVNAIWANHDLVLLHGSSGQSGCHKRPPELSKSAKGSRCGEGSISTQEAEFARSGEKLPLLWRMIPVVGTKPQVRSLTICSVLPATWKPSSPGFCYPGRRSVQQRTDCRHFLQRHGDAIMEAGCWTFAMCRHGERHHDRFRQGSQKAVDQMKEFHGCLGAGLSCLWSDRRTSPACKRPDP